MPVCGRRILSRGYQWSTADVVIDLMRTHGLSMRQPVRGGNRGHAARRLARSTCCSWPDACHFCEAPKGVGADSRLSHRADPGVRRPIRVLRQPACGFRGHVLGSGGRRHKARRWLTPTSAATLPSTMLTPASVGDGFLRIATAVRSRRKHSERPVSP